MGARGHREAAKDVMTAIGRSRKKPTGPACTEALNEAEEAERRERAEGNAGGVRVERRVRAIHNHGCH